MPAATDVLLEAKGLSRALSAQAAVTDISLTLRRGDVLGLLGLNGAGKSTTLRLFCGVLAADTGSVTIAGHSLADDPLMARQQIGFLPDLPPLYPDMRVSDYLRFCARLRRVAAARVSEQVQSIMHQCDLGDVARQRISRLSKGYRQRVGLAQALVHQPEVVLLDEPSNGLDPQQMQDMRKLIATVGKQHSVIFSTHLVDEAQSVCNRVAVMHRGQLMVDQPIGSAKQALRRLFDTVVHERSESQPGQSAVTQGVAS